MSRSFYDQYEQFLVEPTAYRYRRLRRVLIQSAGWPMELEPLLTAARRVDQGRWDDAETWLESLLPSWLLSPRWHFLGEKIAVARNDTESEHADRFQMHACLKGIMRTGDGSASSPFLVTYPTDSADVLWHLQLDYQSSQLVRSHSGALDVLTCSDGQQIWFDGHSLWDPKATSLEPWPDESHRTKAAPQTAHSFRPAPR